MTDSHILKSDATSAPVMDWADLGLNERLRSMVEDRGWQPTPIQAAAFKDVSTDHDRVLIAPTGSGKTQAVMLPLVHRILEEGLPPLSAIYVTPLRALNRDVERRMAQFVEEAGLTVASRHGDTSTTERNRQVRRPPHLLVTTPETFQLLFTGHRLRAMLANVRMVIVDEVHDLAGSERGWQLAVGLSRLEALIGRKVQRVGLSATIGNPNEVARWLSDEGEPIIAPAPRTTDLQVDQVEVMEEDLSGGVEHGLDPSRHAIIRRLAELVRERAPCLVFVNSRSAAEVTGHRLMSMAPDLRIGVHHGSLARASRVEMEENLRHGKLDALVCTSSLELGIDVGSIDRVLQLGSARSVDRLLQRVGRADHRLGGVGRGVLLTHDHEDLEESTVIALCALKGDLEPVRWRRSPLTVAANQLVQMVHAHGGVRIDVATMVIARTPQFAGWDRARTVELANLLAERWVLRIVEEPERNPEWWTWPQNIWDLIAEACDREGIARPEARPRVRDVQELDERWRSWSPPVPKEFTGGWIGPAGRTRSWARANLSMISDERSYSVRDAVTRKRIGKVDEAFVLSLDSGGEEEDGRTRTFIMAGRAWRILEADPDQEELIVAPMKAGGSAAQWRGELPPVPEGVARTIGRMRRSILNTIDGSDLEDSVGALPLTDHAMDRLVQRIVDHRDAAGVVPDDRCITLESRDGAVVVNACLGSRINETLGHFLASMASTRTGRWGETTIDPTRIVLKASGVDAGLVASWLQETPPESLETILTITLRNSRRIRWRFAQVAKMFGVLDSKVDPRRINLPALMARYRGTMLMEEVMARQFHERMDLDGAIGVLQDIQRGTIGIHLTPPGPLGLSEADARDMVLPNWTDDQVRERLRNRLMGERAVLGCLHCGTIQRFRVGRWLETPRPKHCQSCSGRMMACLPEHRREELEAGLASSEEKDRTRMRRNAELLADRGMEAVLCLMGRGIGEVGARRILDRVPRGSEMDLFEAIHHQEIAYAQTRRFWS